MNAVMTEWKAIPVTGKAMSVYVAKPRDQAIRGSVIVLQEIFGVNGSIQKICDRFASEGYAAWAPDVFHRSGKDRWIGIYDDVATGIEKMSALNVKQFVSDMHTLFDQIALEGEKSISCTGFCMGGTLTYALACALPLKSALCFYGGRIATGPEAGPIQNTASMACPILLFYGALDKNITPEKIEWVRQSLESHQKNFEIVIYPHADHAFMNTERKSFHPDSAEKAWARALSFLDQTLSS